MAKEKKSFWKSYFEVAKSIGEWIWKYFSVWHEEVIELKPSKPADQNSQDTKISSEKNEKKIDYFVYFNLLPYSQLSKPETRFSKLLSSLSIRQIELKYFLIWNIENAQIFLWVKNSKKSEFKNIFYSIYDEGDKIVETKKTFWYDVSYIDLKNFDFSAQNVQNIFSIFEQIPSDQSLVFEFSFEPKIVSSATSEGEWENITIKKTQNIKTSLWFFSTQPDFVQPLIENSFSTQNQISISQKNISITKNPSEISNLIFLPSYESKLPLEYVNYKRLRAPNILPLVWEKNVCSIWKLDFKGQENEFWINQSDKLKHAYILWKTGTWKTTLLQHMILDDIKNWLWVWVLDPHWDLVNDILHSIPENRIEDVILIDITDTDFPIGINPFHYSQNAPKDLVISSIVSSFKKIYGYSRGPRLEDILRRSIISLMNFPWATLLHLPKFLTDKRFRKAVLSYWDELDNEFWLGQYESRSDKFRDEAINPVTNKIWQFLSSSVLRNIFSQAWENFSLYDAMNEQKIILINLSKWKIWEDNASALWSFLITKFQIDAMTRASMPLAERKEFFLYVDEFQNFATESFASIFSELRKYKLGLVVANQYVSQVEEWMRNAIFWNIGSIITFNLWPNDAPYLASQFKWKLTSDDIISLPNWHFYTKLMINGVTSDPFSAQTIVNESSPDPEKVERIYSLSRQKYAKTKSQVQEEISNISSIKNIENSQNIEASQNISWPKEAEKPKSKAKKPTKKPVSKSASESETVEKIQKTENIESLWIEDQDILDWIVKLKYNYGLFVQAWELEWLLHKNEIVDENRKENFDIWDSIKVKIIWYKEVDWEKKAVWSQK